MGGPRYVTWSARLLSPPTYAGLSLRYTQFRQVGHQIFTRG